MAPTVGIAGLTGKFAQSITRVLLANPAVKIHGYCRSPSKLPADLTSSPRINITQGDADDAASIRKFVRGCNVVLCGYLGDPTLMTNGQKTLIDACADEGVSRYIAGDFCMDLAQIPKGALPPKDACKEIQEYLQTKQSVQGTHIYIGVFMETLWSNYMPFWDPATKTLTYWGTGKEVWESTTYGTAAEFTAKVALDESATGPQHFLGDRKTTLEIADLFSKVYNTQVTLKNLGSLEELYKDMHEVLAKDPANIFAWMPKFFYYWSQIGTGALKKDLDNSKYPDVKPVTFEDFLRKYPIDELNVAVNSLTK